MGEIFAYKYLKGKLFLIALGKIGKSALLLGEVFYMELVCLVKV